MGTRRRTLGHPPLHMDRHDHADGVACVFERIYCLLRSPVFSCAGGHAHERVACSIQACWAQTNLEVGVLPTAAMKLAKDLEKIRKIRRRLAKSKPIVMMPTGGKTPDTKLVGTVALQCNSDAMLVMAKYFGVEKRATIPFLEKEVQKLFETVGHDAGNKEDKGVRQLFRMIQRARNELADHGEAEPEDIQAPGADERGHDPEMIESRRG
ncbi:unnamed protein product [Symbiodinium sp. CCMP2592]|nr:unnamed protein product [Symbiodinium sp. CCMP2592]